jgi:hypothetical protein
MSSRHVSIDHQAVVLDDVVPNIRQVDHDLEGQRASMERPAAEAWIRMLSPDQGATARLEVEHGGAVGFLRFHTERQTSGLPSRSGQVKPGSTSGLPPNLDAPTGSSASGTRRVVILKDGSARAANSAALGIPAFRSISATRFAIRLRGSAIAFP